LPEPIDHSNEEERDHGQVAVVPDVIEDKIDLVEVHLNMIEGGYLLSF
jgi:hypothetical protein